MRLIIGVFLTVNFFTVQASHIVGGEIYYDYLGANNYRFYISVYRDCNSTGAAFDNPLSLAVYSSNNILVQNVQIPLGNVVPVPVVFNNPCVTPPNNICTQNTVYVTDINLPPTPGGYTISYQRCCRGPNISNLVNPDDTGFTLTCNVPGTANSNYINSSPRFIDYPPLLLCNNDDLIFDHSATDPDGDQLVYSLFQPFSGASSINPAPSPAPPPPYGNVIWDAGISTANPLGPGASISIDPTTGLLTASPNLTGLFVVGIQVQELRNGVVINSTKRDFLFSVFNCQLQLEALLPEQDQLPGFNSYCDGLTIDFVNNSYGGTNYEWDFGVPGITTDVSSAFAPSYTYPAAGQYQVMLVVNPGWPCTDTTYMDINVNNEIDVSFTSNDSMCVLDNSFDFVATTTGPPNTNITWDFGPNANPANGSGNPFDDVVFDQAGTFDVTVEAEFGVCTATFSSSVYVFPEPISGIELPDDIECGGLTISFGNLTQNATDYEWDFGDGTATSSDFAPTHTFPGPGTYTITLSSWSSPACINSTEETITINEELEVAFSSADYGCITNNSFDFDGTVSGPVGAVFTWNFGPNASISTSNDEDVFDVSFDTTGTIAITLTGTFEDCIESITQEIYIYQSPEISFSIESGQQCVPFNAQFIDESFAETEIQYFWDFGDGNTSNDQHPTNLYLDTGQFIVTLSIVTATGCIDTLTLSQDDLVHVRPIPEAGFSVDPDYTDICHSGVHFTDESFGGYEYYYWFDDVGLFSEEQNPAHLYLYAGSHYPMQVVANEWGCKDTAWNELYIEPFTVFAPNSFTPDGDEFNNVFKPIVYLHVEEWKLEIFDRWGHPVFTSLDVDYGWDGTGVNGKLVQAGSYVWRITYTSCEPINPDQVLSGHISVLR